MSLRKRGGKWHFRIKVNGKEYAETTGLAATKRNMRKARQLESKILDALLEGRAPVRRVAVRDFPSAVKDFLTWAKAHYQDHPNSYKRVKTSLASALAFFGTAPVSLIDPARVEQYKAWRVGEHAVRNITVRHDLHALSKFFAYAMLQNWTTTNPIRQVDIPSDKDAVRIHVLTPIEEKEYFRRARKHPDLYDVACLILNQGMRPEEVTVLAKVNVNLKQGQLQITRGKSTASRRTLDLTTESRRILSRRMRGGSQWVFPSKRNPGRHIGRLNSTHDRLVRNAAREGVKINWVLYDLRHTFATRLAQSGVDLVTLAAILGHESLRLVQKYVHPTAAHKKAAMARYDRVLRGAAKKSHRGAYSLRNSSRE